MLLSKTMCNRYDSTGSFPIRCRSTPILCFFGLECGIRLAQSTIRDWTGWTGRSDSIVKTMTSNDIYVILSQSFQRYRGKWRTFLWHCMVEFVQGKFFLKYCECLSWALYIVIRAHPSIQNFLCRKASNTRREFSSELNLLKEPVLQLGTKEKPYSLGMISTPFKFTAKIIICWVSTQTKINLYQDTQLLFQWHVSIHYPFFHGICNSYIWYKAMYILIHVYFNLTGCRPVISELKLK